MLQRPTTRDGERSTGCGRPHTRLLPDTPTSSILQHVPCKANSTPGRNGTRGKQMIISSCLLRKHIADSIKLDSHVRVNLVGKKFCSKEKTQVFSAGSDASSFTFVFIDEKWKNENEALFECYSCVSYCHFPFICEEGKMKKLKVESYLKPALGGSSVFSEKYLLEGLTYILSFLT